MEAPLHWRLKKQRYTMTGAVCPHCSTPMFPPREICPECGLSTKAHEECPAEIDSVRVSILAEKIAAL